MQTDIFKRRYIGLPPGTPVYVGDRPAAEMDLSIITYNHSSAEMKYLKEVDEIPQYMNESKISWINVSGLKDIDAIKQLGKLFTIHPLSVEDILNTEQQPKAEIFDSYSFFSVKSIQQGADGFLIDQISIICFKNTLITFQEIPGDSFDGIRKRILDDVGQIRKLGADYLAYALIDAVVDEYFLALDRLECDLEDYEDRAAAAGDDSFLEEIQDTKKHLLKIKRAVLPLNHNLLVISRQENSMVNSELKPFFQDLRENISGVTVTIESYREWLTNIMEVNLSMLSHQMNKVMKVLTLISTIFIPLTFIVGVYGMNFDVMPELRYRLGYPIVMGVMALIAVIMLIFFRRRKWL
ncbi:MAG: magnesium/cobalt transporter CorA [Treponemataceae bacterium]|nr:MAG: magnesium/cobalt transporter CorA [Treponemataceae bacterium]